MASRQGNRVSQVPGTSLGARCLLPPRGVRLVLWVVASQAMLASPPLAGWPLPSKRNEAEPSSRDATARAFASPSLGEQSRPRSLWVWLRDFRPIITINTFQLTRTAKLAWRFPKAQRRQVATAHPNSARRTRRTRRKESKSASFCVFCGQKISRSPVPSANGGSVQQSGYPKSSVITQVQWT